MESSDDANRFIPGKFRGFIIALYCNKNRRQRGLKEGDLILPMDQILHNSHWSIVVLRSFPKALASFETRITTPVFVLEQCLNKDLYMY